MQCNQSATLPHPSNITPTARSTAAAPLFSKSNNTHTPHHYPAHRYGSLSSLRSSTTRPTISAHPALAASATVVSTSAR